MTLTFKAEIQDSIPFFFAVSALSLTVFHPFKLHMKPPNVLLLFLGHGGLLFLTAQLNMPLNIPVYYCLLGCCWLADVTFMVHGLFLVNDVIERQPLHQNGFHTNKALPSLSSMWLDNLSYLIPFKK